MPTKNDENGGGAPASGPRAPLSRREFVEAAAIAGAGLATFGMSMQAEAGASLPRTVEDPSNVRIAEHWDTLEAIPPPDQWKNSNGKF